MNRDFSRSFDEALEPEHKSKNYLLNKQTMAQIFLAETFTSG